MKQFPQFYEYYNTAKLAAPLLHPDNTNDLIHYMSDEGQEKLSLIEKEIEKARNQVTDASVIKEKLEGDIKVYEEQIRAASVNAEHFRSRKETVSSDAERARAEEQEILSRKKETDLKVDELRGEQMR
jgi:septal ring factor EnvC (AmiA/AmiB activator)